MSQQCALAAKVARSTSGYLSKRAASRTGEHTILLQLILMCLLGERHSHTAASPPNQVQAVADDMQEAEWIHLLSLKNRRRDFTALFQQLMGGYRGDGARCFSDVHGRGTRGSRHKLQKEKFQQSIHKRKKITMSGEKCWNKSPRETVVSPVLQITKSWATWSNPPWGVGYSVWVVAWSPLQRKLFCTFILLFCD